MAGLIQVGRRRTFVFFFVPIAMIFTAEALLESDILTHYIDDAVDVALGLIALAYFAATRKNATKLASANRLATIMGGLIIVATLYAITQEFNDPMDFGNEIPTIFIGFMLIMNRVVVGPRLPEEAEPSADKEKTNKELNRRRASLWFLILVLLVTGYFVSTGPYDFRSLAIDAVLLVAALVGLVVAVQSRHNFTFVGLRRVNNIHVALVVVALIVSLVGGIPPLIFFSVAFVVNRFV